MSHHMSALPLSPFKVADFTWIGAGSYTTKLLADFGADVVKIESGKRLDTLRGSRPFKDGVAGVNRSGYFADRNSSKRSITLDLKTPRGHELAMDLIRGSDVVTNNFTPGTMEKFGLGYEAVRQVRPDIVYISMSMQGRSGPEANYLGYGLTMGALTGLHYLCGLPEEEPAGTGTNFPDHVPNPCHAAFAILAALRHRRKTGQGQYIDLAQIEPTISLLGPAVLDYTTNGRVTERRGNRHVAAAPYGVYPCAGEDRWIAISAGDQPAWGVLAETLGAADLASDSRFATPLQRWRHREELDARIAQLTAGWNSQELMDQLQKRGVAAAAVRDAADVLHHDPQLQAREHWAYLDHPEMGSSVYGAPPFKLSRTPGFPSRPAPLLGQHTDEVLGSCLGLDRARIEALRHDGVLD